MQNIKLFWLKNIRGIEKVSQDKKIYQTNNNLKFLICLNLNLYSNSYL